MKNRIADYLPSSWSDLKAEAPIVKAASDSCKRWSESARQYVINHPGPALGMAFAAGVAIAWWLKRR
jgi:hypothetical protein